MVGETFPCREDFLRALWAPAVNQRAVITAEPSGVKKHQISVCAIAKIEYPSGQFWPNVLVKSTFRPLFRGISCGPGGMFEAMCCKEKTQCRPCPLLAVDRCSRHQS